METNTEKRLCVISIIVEDRDVSGKVNAVLGELGDEIVGRMGLPIKEKEVSVITVVAYSDMKAINSVTGRLGMICGVSAKTLMR